MFAVFQIADVVNVFVVPGLMTIQAPTKLNKVTFTALKCGCGEGN